ncbi:MAG: response regulator [Gammaproteobacteria bacterium]|nr:response regulator [Gammaproteobacteria bacterium]MCK5092125.1 response regulator [Gammaproteobacteria bacterium]
MKIRVLLIDDHALFRIGLEALLDRRGIEVVASVGDGNEGIQLAKDTNPDAILLDMRMPNINGANVLQKLREDGVETPVAMLTTSNEEQDLITSLRNGAQGYLLKDMEPDELVNALNEIVSGKTVVAPELAPVLAKVVQQGDQEPPEETTPFSDLTPREHEILCLLAEGLSNKVIAKNLGISDGTVKLHVKSILRKLKIHSRVEAAVMAVERNLCQKTRTVS